MRDGRRGATRRRCPRTSTSGRPGRRLTGASTAGALALLALAGCGDGDALGPRDPASLHTELVVEAAPEGLLAAVVVDSVHWDPAALLPTGDDEILEVEGPYRIDFRNTSDQALVLRYDLRFYDDSDVFVDNFIPFGLPVRLDPGGTHRDEGRFVIRSNPRIGRFRLLLMRIALRVALPEGIGQARPVPVPGRGSLRP